MLLTNRFGEFAASESSRVQVTEAAGPSAFLEMNTRPVPVAAQSVPVSPDARATCAMKFPALVPRALLVRSPADPPSSTQSPQVALAPSVMNSGQFASRKAWLPPLSVVRQTPCKPANIDPAFARFGSAMIGM